MPVSGTMKHAGSKFAALVREGRCLEELHGGGAPRTGRSLTWQKKRGPDYWEWLWLAFIVVVLIFIFRFLYGLFFSTPEPVPDPQQSELTSTPPALDPAPVPPPPVSLLPAHKLTPAEAAAAIEEMNETIKELNTAPTFPPEKPKKKSHKAK